MIDRNSQDVSFGSAGDVAIQQSTTRAKAVDVGAFSSSSSLAAAPDGPSGSDRLLNTILGVTGKIADKGWQQSREEAYLDGVSKAGTVQSEDDLQSNIMTKDWQTAGYRDTMGRLAMADQQATIATDLKTMADQSPTKYQDYLATKRGELLPQLEGMSLQARQQMFAQTMLTERANISKQAAAHYEFIMDTKHKSVATMSRGYADAADAALKKSPNPDDPSVAYKDGINAWYGSAVTMINNDPSVPREMKGSWVKEIASYALDHNHQAMYQKMKHTVTGQDANGNDLTLMSNLSLDDEATLDGKFKDSVKRTQIYAERDYIAKSSQVESALKDPDQPLMSWDDYQAHVTEGQDRGLITTPEQTKAKWDIWNDAAAKKSANLGLITAYQSGQMWGTGHTDEEGAVAMVHSLKGLPLDQATDMMFNIGLKNNSASAFKQIGAMTQTAWARVGRQEKLDPTDEKVISSIVNRLKQAKSDGKPGLAQQVMEGMDPDARAKFSYIQDAMGRGVPANEAAIGAVAQLVVDAKLGGQGYVTEMTSKNAQDDIKAIQGLTDVGVFGTFTGKVHSFFSADAAARSKITPEGQWFEDSGRRAEGMEMSKIATMQRLAEISKYHPYLPADARLSMALAQTAEDTVMTKGGPIIAPMGQSVRDLFGVPASTPQDFIGKAIDEKIHAGDGNRASYRFNADTNHIMFQVHNKDNALVDSGQFDPKEIKPLVEAIKQDRATKASVELGAGVTVKSNAKGDNSQVTVNGVNTAGIDTGWMVRVRKHIAENEQVRNKPYPDASGKIVDGKPVMTVGVGVSSHNARFYPKVEADGTVTPDNINRSFAGASNAAAVNGARVMRATGKTSEPAFQFFTELAYQAGGDFDHNSKAPAYPRMVAAIRANDYPAAQLALEQTSAWGYTKDGSSRRESYRSNLKKLMTQ